MIRRGWRPDDDAVVEKRTDEAIAQTVALRFRLLEASEHLAEFVDDVRDEIERRRRVAGGGEKDR